MGDLATLYIKVGSKEVVAGRLNLTKLGVAATKTAGQVDKVTKSSANLSAQQKVTASEFSSSAKIIGRDLSRYVTLPFLAASGASLKFSKELTNGLGQVETLIAGTGDRIYELQDLVTGLSSSTGVGFSELTRGLYETISAFQDGADTAGRFETAVKASVAGNSTVLESVKLISAVTKAYGDTSEEAAEKVADLAFAAVKYGQTTFGDLANAIQKVTSNSDRLGVSQEELFSIYSTLTGVTGDAAGVTTQFNRILLSLANPTEALTALFAKYRTEQGEVVKTGEQFVKANGGAVGALRAIRDAAEESGETFQTYITRATGVTAAVALTGNQLDVFLDKFELVTDYTDQMSDAFFAATTGIDEYQRVLLQVKQTLAGVGAEIGQILLPVIITIAQRIADAATRFSELDEKTQKTRIAIFALAAAVGPLLIVFGSLLRLAKGVADVMILLNSGALAGLIALAPVAAVVVGIAALAFADWWLEIKRTADQLEALKEASSVVNGVSSSFYEIANSFSDLNDAEEVNVDLNNALVQQFPLLEGVIDSTTESVGGLYTKLLELQAYEYTQTLTPYQEELDELNKAMQGQMSTSSQYLELIKTNFGAEFKNAGGSIDEFIATMEQNPHLSANVTLKEYVSQYVTARKKVEALATDVSAFFDDIDKKTRMRTGGLLGIDKELTGTLTATVLGELELNTDDAETLIVETTGADDTGSRLKTWEDYFASITGIAGEAFAHIERNAEGDAVGYFSGTGKDAASAYSKAFREELDLTAAISSEVGMGFTLEDRSSVLESQLDKATSDIQSLLEQKVNELNEEGLNFSVADMLMGDDVSIEKMIEVFGIADSSIQGLIDEANRVRSALNATNLGILFEDWDKQLSEFAKTKEDALTGRFIDPQSAAMDVAEFDLLSDKLADLKERKAELKEQTMLSNSDINTLYDLNDAIAGTEIDLEKAGSAYGVVQAKMEEFGSVGEAVASSVYDGFIKIGLGAESAYAATTIVTGMIDALGTSLTSTATALGEALGGADDFEQAMGDIALQLADTLSALALAAGLQIIIASAGANPLGYALVAMGLAGNIMSGYVSAQAEENAKGGVYEGSVKKYAKGDALSNFSNSIVNTPTLFNNGAGLMGEAGAEAIIPLTRASNGELGVNAAGIGGGSSGVVIVTINNYSSEEASVEETTNSEGTTEYAVTIGKAVSSAIASGKADTSMKSRFGLSVQGLN